MSSPAMSPQALPQLPQRRRFPLRALAPRHPAWQLARAQDRCRNRADGMEIILWYPARPAGQLPHALAAGDAAAKPDPRLTWTERGIKNFPDTIKRAREFSRHVETAGGRMRELLWTVGEYDLIHISEFATDESAAAAYLRLASAGNVRVRTMRAFNAKEMENVINLTGVRMNTAAGAEHRAGCDGPAQPPGGSLVPLRSGIRRRRQSRLRPCLASTNSGLVPGATLNE